MEIFHEESKFGIKEEDSFYPFKILQIRSDGEHNENNRNENNHKIPTE